MQLFLIGKIPYQKQLVVFGAYCENTTSHNSVISRKRAIGLYVVLSADQCNPVTIILTLSGAAGTVCLSFYSIVLWTDCVVIVT